MQVSCGDLVVAVDVPKYEVDFTDSEQRQIRLIAKVNKLTWVRGMEIDIDQMTEPKSFKFYFLSAEQEKHHESNSCKKPVAQARP